MKQCAPGTGSVSMEGETVKIRRGWFIVWPDGSKWLEDCPELASKPLMPGAVRVPIRILGFGRWPCSYCTHGTAHK